MYKFMKKTSQTGLLVVISSPSGGGKDTVINALLKKIPHSARLISTTTRLPRPKNKDGVDYNFITPEEFKNKIKNGDFLEYNIYVGNYYGTDEKMLKEKLSEHPVVFTQIETNGKHNLDKKNIKNLSIFLMPEKISDLKKRIEKRGGISQDEIRERLRVTDEQIAQSTDYDYHVINVEGKLEETIAEVEKIIKNYLSRT